MLNKLAFRNVKRSIKDYIIYLITITISFSLIFALNLISSSEAVVELSKGLDTFAYVLYFINAIVIFVICFLINYTTKFMFEKRSKEFGMYMLLGIKKKKNISNVFNRKFINRITFISISNSNRIYCKPIYVNGNS